MSSTLRVCALIQSFRPILGGAQIQLEHLLPHLAARGVDTTILARGVPGTSRREGLAHGELRRTALPGDSAGASLIYVGSGAAHLIGRRRRYDVVHAHGALSEAAIGLCGDTVGLPLLVKVLRAGPEGDLQTLARRPAGGLRLRRLLKRAWFVAISEDIRAELEHLGVPATRIVEIPNGVDTSRFRPVGEAEKRRLREQLKLPAGALLVYTGRLDAIKRLDVLVRAIAKVPDARLVLVGDGPDRSRLEALSAELGAGDRVRFAGRTDDVAAYLRASDAFATPSRAEGLSNALLEALACGLPCLAAPASGVPQLLGHGRGQVIEDDMAWPQAIAAAVGGQAAGASNAAEYVRAHFSLERTADGLASTYARMVEERTRPVPQRGP